MTKNMCVHIDIDTDSDTPQRVMDLICALIEEANDRYFAIDLVTIDGAENFKMGKGFMGEMARHFVK